jgi:hypothetical protein
MNAIGTRRQAPGVTRIVRRGVVDDTAMRVRDERLDLVRDALARPAAGR